MPFNTAFLSRLSYRETQGKILCSFDSTVETHEFEFGFVPEIRMPANKAVVALAENLVSPQGRAEFVQGKKGGFCAIRSQSVSSLKEAHALLSLSLRSPIPFLEPERQFLIEKNWTYFDLFSIAGVPEKKHKNYFPPGTPLTEAILSGFLRIPINRIPESPMDIGKIMLENTAFAAHNFLNIQVQQQERYFKNQKLVEVDFSEAMLSRIFTANLGSESINCDCCTPKDIREKNVLPCSLVEAEFLEDGFYFESTIPSFAYQFHLENPNKQSRNSRKKEFFLDCFPVGPFYCGQKQLVPLVDAKFLEKTNRAVINEEVSSLNWHCNQKKSALASLVESLLESVFTGRHNCLELERNEIAKKGLGAFNPCFESRKKQEFSAELKSNELLCRALFEALSVSLHGTDPVGQSIEAFQSEMLVDCNRELIQRKAEPLYLRAGKLFIRGIESFTDLAIVSKEVGIPSPSLY